MDIQKLIGLKVREFRKAKGLSQEALGEKAGFKFSYIGSVERGEKNISINNLVKIAIALDIEIYQFFVLVREYEQLTESEVDKEIRGILHTLENQDVVGLKRANAIIRALFERYE